MKELTEVQREKAALKNQIEQLAKVLPPNWQLWGVYRTKDFKVAAARALGFARRVRQSREELTHQIENLKAFYK